MGKHKLGNKNWEMIFGDTDRKNTSRKNTCQTIQVGKYESEIQVGKVQIRKY